MTRKTWVLVIASVLVSSIVLEGQVFAEGERKKIVMLSNSTDLGLLLGVLQDPLQNPPLNGINVVHPLSMINAVAIALPLNRTVEEGLASLQNLMSGLSVLGVYNDLAVSVLPIIPALPGVVSLTHDSYTWGLQRIDADVAHQAMPALTGSGVQVAIVDTGVGTGVGDLVVAGCTHPDLPLIVDGFNALPGGGAYCDGHGHGTHIAGIIAARVNSYGLIGVAPEASIVAVKVLDANGQGYLSDVIFGLLWIYIHQIEKQIWLINMSLGFSTGSLPLQKAIEILYDRGTLMVASAGNSCSDYPGQSESGGDAGVPPTCDAPQTTDVKYPAAYSQVLAVTATDASNPSQITSYSVAGPQVDVAAPGGSSETPWVTHRILSTYKGGVYGYGIGTSQAAAHVTGALALKLQQQLPQQPLQQQTALSLADVQLALAHTATHLQYPATQQGWGLLNVECLLLWAWPQPPPQCPLQ